MIASFKYDFYIEEFFNRIGFLQGSLYHLDVDLKGFQKQFVRNSSEKLDIDFRLGTRLVISDLSGPTDNGWIIRYPTDVKYRVTISDYEKYTQNLVYEYSAFALLQAYEAFTLFIKSILASYFQSNVHLAYKVGIIRGKRAKCFLKPLMVLFLKKKENNKILDFNNLMNNMNCGKNNSNLFKYLRKLSQHYKHHEINNNRSINLIDFSKVFAIARHSITHNASIISAKSLDSLNKGQLEILKYFVENDKLSGKMIIKLTQKKSSEILVIISEHAFLIFKSLSICSGQDWKILKNM
jgi:hypothetical protein